jgi:hemolysin III
MELPQVMKLSRERHASSPDACPGQISWDYDRAEIIADGAVHAIGICLGLIGAVTIVVMSSEHLDSWLGAAVSPARPTGCLAP